ncbi:MAG: hypothetical protein E7Z80_07975 [Methanobrevibacter thaueri]|nr:hypothetical protein [Methanobrevibacter thaueri]
MSDIFEFIEFLNFAQKIFDERRMLVSSSNFSDQCLYRVVINRCYYAAFNHAKTWLNIEQGFETRIFDENKGKSVNKDGKSEHVLVYEELKNVANNQSSRLKSKFHSSSSKLENLFKKRVTADYKENLFKEQEVRDAIISAKSIIDFLEYGMDCN